MWIGIHLVRSGLITQDQLLEAIEFCEERKPPLGRIAIEKGKLSAAECSRILSRQAIQPDEFGQLARELRLLSKRQLADLLFEQAEQTPSLATALVATQAISPEQLNRELARGRFERRLREEDESEPQLCLQLSSRRGGDQQESTGPTSTNDVNA